MLSLVIGGDNMTKGDRLKYLRQKNNYTLEEIGKKINVTRQTYFKYENDIITNIPTDKIEELAKIYHVSESYIMGWSETISSSMILTEEEETLIKKYRALDDRGKENVIATLDREYEHSKENDEPPSENKAG